MPALHVTGNVMSTDASAGYAPLLEISTKSKSERGRHMSAFHMTATTKEYGKIKLELAFQGSKVFERGAVHGFIPERREGDWRGEARSATEGIGCIDRVSFRGIRFPVGAEDGVLDRKSVV